MACENGGNGSGRVVVVENGRRGDDFYATYSEFEEDVVIRGHATKSVDNYRIDTIAFTIIVKTIPLADLMEDDGEMPPNESEDGDINIIKRLREIEKEREQIKRRLDQLLMEAQYLQAKKTKFE